MTFIDTLLSSGLGGLFAGAVLYFLGRYFLTSYFGEKGKNLATKEDVAEITREIEKVRTQYAILLEERKASHQFRVAAIEKRLQAHQEAFTHWREIMRTVHSDGIGKTTMACREWWEKNCLYLEQSVREAFLLSMNCAHDHVQLLTCRQDVESINKNWACIVAAGPVILAAVKLPGLTAVESDELTELSKANGIN